MAYRKAFRFTGVQRHRWTPAQSVNNVEFFKRFLNKLLDKYFVI